MAPTKKKKKKFPINPARGFATTSTASKTKEKTVDELEIVDQPEESAQHEELGSRPGTIHLSGTSATSGSNLLQDMSPEELELELETCSLQSLIDKYHEKTRKNASRQVSRLQTEKRLTRSKAEPLVTRQWLPEETMQCILQLHAAQSNTSGTHPQDFGLTRTLFSVVEDDLIVKLWTLKRLLPQLGFTEGQARLGVEHLLVKKPEEASQDTFISKDSIWGLEECLDWLALTYKSENLPSYSSQSAPALSQVPTDGASFVEDTTSIGRLESMPSAPFSGMTAARPISSDESSLICSESDFDSDVEPAQQLQRYMSLKSRLYDVDPALVDPNRKKPKDAAFGASNFKNGERANLEMKVARLLAKLDKIHADILFDVEQAENKWAEHWARLAKEMCEREKLGICGTSNHDHRGRNTQKLDNFVPDSKVPDLTNDDPDADYMLGGLFSDPPEGATDLASGTSSINAKDADVPTMVSRSFGKWNGISPRRVFEEACRARDSSAQIEYKLISASNISNRHSVEVRWSRPQQLSLTKSIDHVSHQFNSCSIRLEMLSVSCPDTLQSEAYISTLSLFVIFASSPKEEKVYLRLPSIWRDFWTELSIVRKERDDAQDREVLRELRGIINGHRYTTDQVPECSTDLEPPKLQTYQPNITRIPASSNILVNEEMRNLWLSKASTASYKKMLTCRMALPIWKFKDELLGAIEQNKVVIVCGETGCGKSTQVPAFILEYELLSGRSCKVYCTEPRRISAISLARRVSEEMGENRGDVGTPRSLVGYAIRLESQVNAQTRLVYATTGIVMRMLERSDDLEDVTHVILDEVHERSIDSDFLFIVLRKLLVRRTDLKIVLMSATVDAQRFSDYFGHAPILNVPGRTFPVTTRYLEDAIELTTFDANQRDRDAGEFEDNDEDIIHDSIAKTTLSADKLKVYSANTCHALRAYDELCLNYDLILRLLESIATVDEYVPYSNAILVFLPGIGEIKRVNDMLMAHGLFMRGWYIHALHSSIATDEQERAFVVPPSGYRKIVLATNIAETGITIPDITCVIDTGKHKEMRFDERRQLSRLIEVFISRANAKQRRGRAGRVQRGLCFHLFTSNRHDTIMAEEQTPEILRLSLQDLVLRVKICKLGGIQQTLSEALDPPSAKNIQRAIDSLVDVKALNTTEDLTPLGRQLAKLPLDVFLGKLLLLGTIFRCSDAMITIAAILSAKSPFSARIGQRSQADAARLAFKKGDSDLLTVYNAYSAWRRICTSNVMPEYQFCRKYFLNAQTLSNIEELKAQLTSSLVDAGFMRLDDSEKASLNRVRFHFKRRKFVEIPARYDTENYDLMHNTVIACSFYPRLLKREGKGWRNIANNQSVSLHPTSINKGAANASNWLSFYHVMQSSSKFYNAHETGPVEDFVVALICGEAEFKMYSGMIIIDGNRIRFSVDDWKTMLAMKVLRTQLRQIMAQSFRKPGRSLSQDQRSWLDIWQKIVSSRANAQAQQS